ncbi:acyl carrier protein [Nostoc sp. CHAB 5834]|nr:acyl carrier protein [Nostoc sp. CHAB 5834]
MSKVSEINKTDASNQIRTAADIQAWTISYLGELLEVDPEEVDITIPFDRYGLDSSAAIGLTGDLGDWLGYDVDPTLLYDYPTIEGLIKHLSADLN